MQEKNELFSLKQQKSNVGYFYLCIFYLFGTHLRIIAAAHSWHAPVSYFLQMPPRSDYFPFGVAWQGPKYINLR